MSERFYRVTTAVSRWVGIWFFRFSAGIVAAGFFLGCPRRVGNSIRFYRALFPDRGWFSALLATWRQYQGFTTVFVDRFRLREAGRLDHRSQGLEHLRAAVRSGTGGVILMSHIGNWEVAAHLLRRSGDDFPLLLFMGARQKEEIERRQKASLARSGVRIIAADEGGGSPYDVIEGVRHLRAGGLVSLTGDVVWHPGQRTVTVPFLGRTARLPEMPHALALAAGAPLFVLFAIRTGAGQYDFSVTPPMSVTATPRADRPEAIPRSARRYAALLEAKVREHPDQWYHFGPFLDESPGQTDRHTP